MNKEEILIALKEIHARYCIPASEQNYTDKDYACMQYEKLVIHLQNEIGRLNNIINELESYLEQQWLEWKDDCDEGIVAMANEDKTVLDKLQALKENNK